MEWLENRQMLAAIARFDFDSMANEAGPDGWTHMYPGIANDQVIDLASQIGVKLLAGNPTGYTANYNDATVPADADTPEIKNGIQSGTGLSSFTFALFNLIPSKSYEVWVLGGNVSGTPSMQQILIDGGGPNSPTFSQTIASLNLAINSSAGTNSLDVTQFAPIFVQSPLFEDGLGNAIRVTTTESSGMGRARIAGVVIREFELPTSFTLPPSGGPFSLLVEGGNRVVKNNSGMLLTTLASTGAITINGTVAASDELNVNLSSGNPVTGGVTFHGGTGANDKLTITGGSQGVVTYNYTNANDGSVVMSNFGTVTYTGLEPIVNTGTATDVVFNLPATTDVAFLEDNGATQADGMLRLRSAPVTFELTDFAIPSSSLTVNLGAGGDSFTVSTVPQFTAALTINGGTGDDAIAMNSLINFASGRNLNIDLQDDDVAPGIDTISIGTSAALTLSGGGAATLRASKNIALAVGSSIVTASGPLLLAANQQTTPTAGDFVGLDITGGTIKSSSGDISLAGRGGTGAVAQVGVHIRGLASIGDTTTGAVNVAGLGGNTPTGSLGGNVGVLVENSTIKSVGNIQVTGTGGADADDLGGNHGVMVLESKLNASGAGTLTITGAATSNVANQGIDIEGGADSLKTESGKITLTGTGGSGIIIEGATVTAGADIDLTGSATASGMFGIQSNGNLNTFGAGNIKLTADRMDLLSGVSAESRLVTLLPKTVARAINLGGADSITELGLSDLDQSVVTAGTLQIGDASSGPITVSTNITRPAATAVNLTSDGAIRFAGGLFNSAGGNVTLSPGGTAAASFGKTGTDLNVGSSAVAFASGADLAFAINGITADSGYEVLNVTGDVNLTGTDLLVSGSHMPSAGNTFAIVKYTGTRTGTFSSSTVMLNGQTLNVVYDDANKQVLLNLPGTPTLSATLVGGNLTIRDEDSLGKNNNLTLSASGGNFVISDAVEQFISAPLGGTLSNGNRTLTIPLSPSTDVTISGRGGNDMLTIDFTGSGMSNSIGYNGGTQSGVPGDSLRLVGGMFTTLTHTFSTPDGGIIVLDGKSVIYAGLEPVDMSGTVATNVILNLPSAASNAVLEDDGTSGNGISQIRSANGTFETTTFSNPSGTLRINRGNAAATLTVNALPDFVAGLTIAAAGTEFSTVTFAGAVSLATGKTLSASAGAIITNASLTTSGGSVALTATSGITLGDALVTNGGAVNLTADSDGNGTGTLTIVPAVLEGWATQELTPSGGAPGEAFGAPVSISADGNTAIVGAPYDLGVDAVQGAAYVFTRVGGVWLHQQKLTVGDSVAADLFGGSVAISGDGNTVVVGAHTDDVGANNDQGSAYVFTRTGNVWTQQQQLTAVDGAMGDQFGGPVGLSGDGDTAIVGATRDNVGQNSDQGSAYVFTRSGGVWSQQQQLIAADGAAGDHFGGSVALSADSNTAIVAIPLDDVGGNQSQGSAYVFTRSGSLWTQQQQLTSNDGAASDAFGISVSLSSDGNTAIVGAYVDDVGANTNQGSAYIFTRTGSVWTQQQQLLETNGQANHWFGRSVALSSDGTTAIVGAIFVDIGTNINQGAAYVFTRTSGVWTQVQQLTDAGSDFIGVSVAVSSDGKTVIAGIDRPVQPVDQDTVYVFSHDPGTPGGSIAAAGGNVTITAAGAVIGGPISTSGAGGIELSATSGSITANAPLTAGVGGVTLKADTGIQLATAAADITSSGPIDLNADFDANATGIFSSVTEAKIEQTGSDIPVTITASDITLNGTIDSSGILTLQPSTAGRTIAIHDSAGDFHLDAGELTRAGANNGGRYTIGRIGGTGQVSIGGNGSVQLPTGDFSFHGGNVTFNGQLLTAATAPTLEIISSGAIQQTFGGNAITNASTLILDSAQGVGALANPLRIAAGQSIAARATSSGSVAIASDSSLTSRTLGGVSGISTNGGTIQLEAFDFRVGLNIIGGGPINAGSGAVNITTTSNSFVTSGGLTINDAITAGADSTFTTNALFLNSIGSVNVGGAKLIVRSDASGLPIDLGGPDVSGAALGITNDELDRIIAAALQIGDTPFGGQITISAPINVANNSTAIPTLHLASVGGIIDANSTGIDLTVANLALEAFSGSDTTNLLTTQVSTLSASYLSAGDILISNIGALNIVTQQGLIGVRNNGGDVSLTAAGPLTVTSTTGSAFGETFLSAAGDDQLLTLDAIVGGQGNSAYIADKMILTGNLGSSFGTAVIAPESIADSGDAIQIGSPSAAPNVLSLTDTDWFISGEPIQIGDANSGPITVTANFAPFPSSDFHLVSGGAINFAGGSFNTGGGDLLLSPGEFASVGVAKAGNDVTVGAGHTLSFAAGSDLAIAINGTAVDTQYQQLNVAGGVDLTGVDLAVSLGFSPPAGSKFTLVNITSGDLIAGTFNSLPDGSLFTIGSGPQTALVQISYSGGDGNDVALTVVDPSDPSLHGTSEDDNFLVQRVGPDAQVSLNGTVIFTAPFAPMTRITIDGLGGNDNLNVNLTAGDVVPNANGIVFNGGDPPTAPGDSLTITGGNQGTVTYSHSDGHNGFISMSNFGTVVYRGLEPITNLGSATDVIFDLPAVPSQAVLEDDGTIGNTRLRLRSANGTFETTDFTNPTNSLTIRQGASSAAMLTVEALPDFSAGLEIGVGSAGFANVIFNGAVTLAADKNLVVRANETISFPSVTSDLATSGTGQISLTAGSNVSLAAGSSITTVNGSLTLSANQLPTPATGDFSGILISGATVRSTGTGNVTIFGRGGSSASGNQLMGVLINSGGRVEGGTSGTLSIDGIGGASDGSVKTGVRLQNAGSIITSAGASIFVTGTGGAGGSFNRGVDLFSGAMILAGSSGNVTVQGTGGLATGSENQGVLVNGATTAIASTSGNVQITGAGGGSGASTANGGVVTVSSGSLSAGGAGTLQVTGTAGNAATTSNGVGIGGPLTTGGGHITISGIPVNDSAPGLNLTGLVTPGAGGDVNVFADRITIAAPGGINAPSQFVTLRPITPFRTIDLGGPDSAFTLGLTDTELDLITAGTLQIGDGMSSAIHITADITRPTPTNVNLISTGSVHFISGFLSTAGGNLSLFPDASAVVTALTAGIDANLTPGGTLSFAPGTDLLLNLNGLAVDTEYHQLNVAGSIELAGVDLVLSPTVGLPPGSKFIIVNNDGVDPVLGTFNGLGEGQVFEVEPGFGFPTFQITYQGGDGNDVVLTTIDPLNPNLEGTSGDDNWLVRRTAANLEVTLNSQLILSTSFAGLNSLSFDGLAGNDSLTVDLAAGDAIPDGGIDFTGGIPTSAPGDKLIITGGDQGTVDYGYTPAANGSVSLSNFGDITFLGLESILNSGTATNVNLLFFGGGSTATFGDDGTPANGLSRFSGPSIVTTDFTNPTNSLSINSGTADSLTINALPDFTASLFVGSATSPLADVTISGGIAFALDKDLSIHAARSILFDDSAGDLSLSGAGSVSLTADQNISLLNGSSITTVNGGISLRANQQPNAATGEFSGILVSGGNVQSSGAGDVTLVGRGGDSPSGFQFGVRVTLGGLVAGGTSGTLNIMGFGGVSTGDSSSGVSVAGPNSLVTSLGANIAIHGTGGAGAAFNRGAVLANGGRISAGGSGSVTIQGVGGIGTLDEAQGVLIDGDLSGIFSTNGDITITGTGGGAGTTVSNGGVVTANGGDIRANGIGRLRITGTAGNPATASLGVNIRAGTSVSAASGEIIITGIAVNPVEPSVGVFGDISGINVLIVADRLSIVAGGFITVGAGDFSLRPLTPLLAIDLGSSDSATALGLSDAEFDRITAATLHIGDASSGPITITADITRLDPTNVNLISGGSIHFLSGSFSTAGGNLFLSPDSAAVVTASNHGIDAILNPTGSLSFAPGSDLSIFINGPAVDTQYDQLNATGTVKLTGVDLVLSGTYTPATEDSFVIVDNDGSDAVIGTFNGLDNGEVFTIDAGPLQGNYQIVYDGGDGNDVVLTAINAAPAFVPIFDQIAVDDEGGLISVPFATLISTGPPRESGQQLEFVILINSNPALFAIPPSIDEFGTLTFTPDFNVAGQAIITVALQDNGGTASGGSDTSGQETFTIDVAKLRVWHNARSSLDVVADGTLAAADALEVINLLNAFGSVEVPTDGRPTGPYYDTNGDGTVAANDALDVINYLNAFGSGPAPDGEGEGEFTPEPRVPSPEPLSPLDDLYTLLATDLATQPKRRR